MKNILVIGGAGFIGSHLTRRLLLTPNVESVIVFDNLSSGHAAWVPRENERVLLSIGNAQDYDHLSSVMKSSHCDTVFLLAANPDIAKAVTEPTIDFDNGTVLTRNVIEAMRVNGVKRLIYFSGSGVYGDVRYTLIEDHMSALPISPYGAAKLAGEAMICAYSHMFGIVASAFRFANVVGPRQTHGVGFDFIAKLKHDPTRLTILGDGTQTKSYIHVDDVLNAVMLVAAGSDDPKYSAFNVSSSDSLTVTEIAALACEVLKIDNETVAFSYTGGDRGWKGDVPFVHFNCEKIQRTGWKCKRTSREAMRAALEAMAKENA